MKFPATLPLLFLLASALPSPARAGALRWESTDLQLTARVGQETLTVRFPFQNRGERPVRILSVDPSCSCVAAEPEQAVCAPGGADAIRVVLNLNGYIGRVRRSLAIATDDPDGRFAELTLTVDIPELATIAPRFVYWKVGDRAEARTAAITLADPATTTVSGFESDNPQFHVALTPAAQAGQYALAIRPESTATASDASIRLGLVVAGRPQTLVIYAAVK